MNMINGWKHLIITIEITREQNYTMLILGTKNAINFKNSNLWNMGTGHDTGTLTLIRIWENNMIQYNYKCWYHVGVGHASLSDTRTPLIRGASVLHNISSNTWLTCCISCLQETSASLWLAFGQLWPIVSE
jgi:hypothetical protein